MSGSVVISIANILGNPTWFNNFIIISKSYKYLDFKNDFEQRGYFNKDRKKNRPKKAQQKPPKQRPLFSPKENGRGACGHVQRALREDERTDHDAARDVRQNASCAAACHEHDLHDPRGELDALQPPKARKDAHGVLRSSRRADGGAHARSEDAGGARGDGGVSERGDGAHRAVRDEPDAPAVPRGVLVQLEAGAGEHAHGVVHGRSEGAERPAGRNREGN